MYRTHPPNLAILIDLQILCAVLNKYYSFAEPFSSQWTFWYIREASTAVLVANMPNCWSLMRRLFNLRSFNGSSGRSKSNTNGYGSKGFTTIAGTSRGGKTNTVVDNASNIKSRNRDGAEGKGGVSWWERETGLVGKKLGRSESEEHIVDGSGVVGGKKAIPLEIWESKQFDVDRGSSADDISSVGKDDAGVNRDVRGIAVVGTKGKSTTTVTISASNGRKSTSSRDS